MSMRAERSTRLAVSSGALGDGAARPPTAAPPHEGRSLSHAQGLSQGARFFSPHSASGLQRSSPNPDQPTERQSINQRDPLRSVATTGQGIDRHVPASSTAGKGRCAIAYVALNHVFIPMRTRSTLLVQRHEHGIRGLTEKTTWYSSSANDLLDHPVPLASTRLNQGDLYVHTATGNRRQVWLWTADGRWMTVQLHHPHPYLKGYVLNILSNGEPSWVTSDTIRTYLSRIKKRARELSAGVEGRTTTG